LKVSVQGVEGEIPFNELSNEKIGKPEDYFAAGDEVQAIIIEVSKDTWVLKLSIRRVLEKAERASYEQYLENDDKNQNQTIGDLFSKDLKSKK